MSARASALVTALGARDYAALVEAVPYARYLGLRVDSDGADERRYVLPYRDAHIGNANLPALHGGTLASLLQLAMQFEALIDMPAPRLPDPVDFTIDYWRSAGASDCIVSAQLIRSGRHIAQVQARCWQDSQERPVAFGRAAFVLRDV